MDRRRRVTANRKRLRIAARDLFESLSPAQQRAIKHLGPGGHVKIRVNGRTMACLREFELAQSAGRYLTPDGEIVHAVANEAIDG